MYTFCFHESQEGTVVTVRSLVSSHLPTLLKKKCPNYVHKTTYLAFNRTGSFWFVSVDFLPLSDFKYFEEFKVLEFER